MGEPPGAGGSLRGKVQACTAQMAAPLSGLACLGAGGGGVCQHALHVLRAALCRALQPVRVLHVPAARDLAGVQQFKGAPERGAHSSSPDGKRCCLSSHSPVCLAQQLAGMQVRSGPALLRAIQLLRGAVCLQHRTGGGSSKQLVASPPG